MTKAEKQAYKNLAVSKPVDPVLWLNEGEVEARTGDNGVRLVLDHDGSGHPAVFLSGPYAAAPDLLTALKALFEHCAMVHMHWGENDNTKEADAAISAACAAIRKATGAE